MKKNSLLLLLAMAAACAAQDTVVTEPNRDSVRAHLKADSIVAAVRRAEAARAGAETIQIRTRGVAFLGIESRADNRFHETLEDRIYLRMSYNKEIELEDRGLFTLLKGKGVLDRKMVTMDQAEALSRAVGDRIYVSGEVRSYRVELKRTLGILPIGKARGEVTCFLQVLDVVTRKPRFAGEIRFVGEMKVGWVGFSNSRELMPLSPMEEKHLIDEMVNGLTELFVETAEASFKGLFERREKKGS